MANEIMSGQPTAIHPDASDITTRVLRIIAKNQRKEVSQVTTESSFEELNIVLDGRGEYRFRD